MIGMIIGTCVNNPVNCYFSLENYFNIYFVGPVRVLPCDSHHEKCQHSRSVEDPCRETEEINQTRNITRDDHQESNQTLQMVHVIVV